MSISACLKDSNVTIPPANLFNEGCSLLQFTLRISQRGLC